MTAQKVSAAGQWRRTFGTGRRHYWLPGLPGLDTCQLISVCGGNGTNHSALMDPEPLRLKCRRCVRAVNDLQSRGILP